HVIRIERNMVLQQLKRNRVQLLSGHARFVDKNAITAIGHAGQETITADKFIVAVGTTPARPENIPFDDRYIITTDELLNLKRLPGSMIVVGGGVIGTEYASIFSNLGVQVTLVEGRSRLLGVVDAEIGEALQYHLRDKGMILRMGERVERIEKVSAPKKMRCQGDCVAQAVLESGKVLSADCLLYCVGRQGATDGLGLEAIGLKTDRRGRITVDGRYQTANPDIYAVGDVVGFPALASTSMNQGRVAACGIYNEPATSMPELFPFGIYAIPEISMVGMNEEELTKKAIPYESGIARYKEIARGHLIGDETGMLKILFHPDSRKILGVHVIGTGATELIHIGQAVMAFDGTVDYFVTNVFNYPTLAECYKVAALNGVNKLRG
ncbi:MAG: Si-specific NAD(P)(+) transhydrogenase, partial [Proteobacteria bacterium]|nr:Si-specific NAD(P)(+) transhydrogenase [Pseudomonadota bacterium]